MLLRSQLSRNCILQSLFQINKQGHPKRIFRAESMLDFRLKQASQEGQDWSPGVTSRARTTQQLVVKVYSTLGRPLHHQLVVLSFKRAFSGYVNHEY